MLKVKELTCGYEDGFFLKNISFKLAEGEIVGIIGPNGSGKTTLIKAISKTIKPKFGEILFHQKNLDKIGYKELSQKIAVVSQNISLSGLYFTVEEFVLLGRIPYRSSWQFIETKRDKELAKKAMILTDTLKIAERQILELSGGEVQRVIIAKALAQEPQLLLLDEPITHLDIKYQIEILDLLRKLNKNGLTIVIILHELNLASEYCERLILLDKGIIRIQGEPSEVLNYKIIEEVYETIVVVKTNPISSKPYILLVSKEKEEK